MRRIAVEIADEAFARLAHLALRERRDVRDQAAVLLEDATAVATRQRRPWRNGGEYDPRTMPESVGRRPVAAGG